MPFYMLQKLSAQPPVKQLPLFHFPLPSKLFGATSIVNAGAAERGRRELARHQRRARAQCSAAPLRYRPCGISVLFLFFSVFLTFFLLLSLNLYVC
jgi:hypothetical protein